jgi:hypothetical protein
MTTPVDEARRSLLLSAFRMPSLQTMVSRKSSITNAFVGALIPLVVPTTEEIEEALAILGMEPENVRCAYCGDKASEWDHLRPLVVKRRPTGFVSEIANLVPACGKCNQSKGNQRWKDWMLGSARFSPTGRGVTGVAERAARLERYEQWRSPTVVDFTSIIGVDEWENYWGLCEALNADMRKAQAVADALRVRILAAIKKG